MRGAQLAHALLAPARRRERVAETGKVLAVDRAEIAHRLAVVAQPPQDVGVFRGGDSLLLLAVLVRSELFPRTPVAERMRSSAGCSASSVVPTVSIRASMSQRSGAPAASVLERK